MENETGMQITTNNQREKVMEDKTLGERDDAAMRAKEMQAYMILQNSFGARVGDTFKILRAAKGMEAGWRCAWSSKMGQFVGKTFRATRVDSFGIKLGEYFFPWFVLEKVPVQDMPGDWFRKFRSSSLFLIVEGDDVVRDDDEGPDPDMDYTYYRLFEIGKQGKVRSSKFCIKLQDVFNGDRDQYTRISAPTTGILAQSEAEQEEEEEEQ